MFHSNDVVSLVLLTPCKGTVMVVIKKGINKKQKKIVNIRPTSIGQLTECELLQLVTNKSAVSLFSWRF